MSYGIILLSPSRVGESGKQHVKQIYYYKFMLCPNRKRVEYGNDDRNGIQTEIFIER